MVLKPCQDDGPAHENVLASANDLVDLCKFVFHRFHRRSGLFQEKRV